mmetsp:Transcript_33294/g.58398  ORF Transcript_33294/g.58398 Transcript_33294/m.58398 type:complete len:153 (+) Transcript_33294:412-870(+)
MLYDGYRSWQRYGKWTTSGMTREQVWNKYEDQVLRELALDEELEESLSEGGLLKKQSDEDTTNNDRLDDEELTARISLRILERSGMTNYVIDRLFLKELVSAEEEDATTASAEKGVLEERRMRRNRQDRVATVIFPAIVTIERVAFSSVTTR